MSVAARGEAGQASRRPAAAIARQLEPRRRLVREPKQIKEIVAAHIIPAPPRGRESSPPSHLGFLLRPRLHGDKYRVSSHYAPRLYRADNSWPRPRWRPPPGSPPRPATGLHLTPSRPLASRAPSEGGGQQRQGPGLPALVTPCPRGPALCCPAPPRPTRPCPLAPGRGGGVRPSSDPLTRKLPPEVSGGTPPPAALPPRTLSAPAAVLPPCLRRASTGNGEAPHTDPWGVQPRLGTLTPPRRPAGHAWPSQTHPR